MAKRKYFVFKQAEGKLRLDFRSWPLVIIIGLILAFLSILDRGGLGEVSSAVTGALCNFSVNADDVNVRTEANASSPSVQKLTRGQTVAATKQVTSGFRQLDNGDWVLDGYLTPLAGSTCG